MQKIAEASQTQAAAARAQADLQKEQQESQFVLSLPSDELTKKYKEMKMEELLLQQQLRNQKIRKELAEYQSP